MYLEEIKFKKFILKDYNDILFLILTIYIFLLICKLNYNFINFCFKNIKIHFIPYLHLPFIVCMYILCYNTNMTLQQLLIFVFIIFILAYNYYIINTFIHPIYQPLIAFLIYYIYLCNLEINNSITKINEIIHFINNELIFNKKV